MLISGTACVLGYLLNRNGRQPRIKKNDQEIFISPNKNPNGPLIYDNHRLEDIDLYTRDLATMKHQNKVKHTFPTEYKNNVTILPTDPFHEELGRVIEDESNGTSADVSYKNAIKLGFATNINNAAYDPQSSNPIQLPSDALIHDSPTFKNLQFKNTAHLIEQFSAQNGNNVEFSLLTGLPIDLTHSNMNPYFGKNSHKNTVSPENSQVLFERFSGYSSSEPQGTYSTRKEVENPFPNNPENLRRADISQLSDSVERANSAIKPSNEYITNTTSFKDLPMNSNTLVYPKNIDETRNPNNKQITYETVVVEGQKGSRRTTEDLIPKARVNPYDFTTENKSFFSTRGSKTNSSLIPQPSIRDNNGTAEFENEYISPATSLFKERNLTERASVIESTHQDILQKGFRTFDPGFGLPKGRSQMSGSDDTTVFIKDLNRSQLNEYIPPATKNIGGVLRDSYDNAAPKYTIRDTLSTNTIGAINPTGKKDNTAWNNVDTIDLPITNKALNSASEYFGVPAKNIGGYKTDFEYGKISTLKETFEKKEYIGPARDSHGGFISRDAESTRNYDTTMLNNDLGVSTNSSLKKAISRDTKVTFDTEKLMVVDYINNPTGIRRNDPEGTLGSTTTFYEKLDFGNQFSHGKIGNGDDAKRNALIKTKDPLETNFRLNPAMKHDDVHDRMHSSSQLLDDATETELPMNLRGVRKNNKLDDILLFKDSSKEVENSRQINLFEKPYKDSLFPTQ